VRVLRRIKHRAGTALITQVTAAVAQTTLHTSGFWLRVQSVMADGRSRQEATVEHWPESGNPIRIIIVCADLKAQMHRVVIAHVLRISIVVTGRSDE